MSFDTDNNYRLDIFNSTDIFNAINLAAHVPLNLAIVKTVVSSHDPTYISQTSSLVQAPNFSLPGALLSVDSVSFQQIDCRLPIVDRWSVREGESDSVQ